MIIEVRVATQKEKGDSKAPNESDTERLQIGRQLSKARGNRQMRNGHDEAHSIHSYTLSSLSTNRADVLFALDHSEPRLGNRAQCAILFFVLDRILSASYRFH